MYEPSLVKQAKTVEQLLGKHSNERGAEAAELILLYQLIEVNAKQFENQT